MTRCKNPSGTILRTRGRILALIAIGLLLALLPPAPARAEGSVQLLGPHADPFIALNLTLQVTNTQGTGTGFYQQLLHIPSYRWSNWIATNWSNVNFVYLNGTPVSSWIESNASNSATNTLVWVALANIPAHSSLTFYMDVWNLPTFVWNGNLGPAGIAPQLTGSYGEFDDGGKVFNYYQDFSGSSLPSGWTFSSFTNTFGGGIHTSKAAGGSGYIWETTYSPTAPFIWEMRGAVTAYVLGSGAGNVYVEMLGPTVGNTQSWTGPGDFAPGDCWSYQNACIASTAWSLFVNYTIGIAVTAGGSAYFRNYVQLATSGQTGTYEFGLWQDGGTSGSQGLASYVRERAYPPNDTLPSLSFPVPSPPSNLQVDTFTQTELTLSWAEPTSSVSNETVYLGSSCASLAPFLSTGSHYATAKVGGLLPNATYAFAVTDWTGFANSSQSNCILAQTESYRQLPPAPATDLTLIEIINVLEVALIIVAIIVDARHREHED